MERKDKGKRKIIQPLRYSSAMSISLDEEKPSSQNVTQVLDTNKLLKDAMHVQMIQDGLYSSPQRPHLQFTQDGSPSSVPKPTSSMAPFTPTKTPTRSYTQSSKPTVTQKNSTMITFGSHMLQKDFDQKKKFRPLIGTVLTEKQQCLLDNIWHIQTLPNTTSFKVQVLNALSVYFSEQSQKVPESQNKRFSYYLVIRGTKTGIFNKWDSVAPHVLIDKPLYKGYYSFSEALKKAREVFGVNDFFIEPEEVKTFAEIAKQNPEQFIKAQENVIAQLQEQILRSGKNTHSTQTQIENSLLKQKNEFLEAKNTQLRQELEKKEANTVIHRDFNSFKARILDLPLKQTMQPLFEQFPEFEQLVSDKVCTEFPLLLYQLQGEIIDMAFGPPEKAFKGVTVVQRLQQGGSIPNNLFFLQINLKTTNMPDDQILKYYHNGMIDYIEFNLSPKTETLLNKFGEKFILTAGNMASHSDSSQIGCKIIASFPEAGTHTYRPARKRIFLSHSKDERESLQTYACTREFSYWDDSRNTEPLQHLIGKMIAQNQKTPKISINLFYRPWGRRYRLIAEGHYTQIFAQDNWLMIFPFIGEDEDEDYNENFRQMIVENLDDKDDYDDRTDPGSPQSVDSTHRDF